MKRRWTPEEIAYMRAHYATESPEQIGRVLGRTHKGVAQKARRLGLGRLRRWTPLEDAQLRRRYARESLASIARRLDRTPSAVLIRARRLGLRRCMHRRWTAAEIALLEAEYARTPASLLARRLRRETNAVHMQAWRLGLRKSPALAAESEELLWQLRDRPGVVEYFAQLVGAGAPAIARRLRELEAAGGPEYSAPTP